MASRHLMTALVLVWFSIGAAARQYTLWDAAREHFGREGPLEVTLSSMIPMRDLPGLLAEADLVIEGVVMGADEPHLNPQATAIMTSHRIKAARVFLDRHAVLAEPLADDTVVLVDRVGGEMELLGVRVMMNDSSEQRFVAGERLILFLQPQRETDHYQVIYGRYGWLQVKGGRIAAEPSARHVHQNIEGLETSALAERIGKFLGRNRQ